MMTALRAKLQPAMLSCHRAGYHTSSRYVMRVHRGEYAAGAPFIQQAQDVELWTLATQNEP